MFQIGYIYRLTVFSGQREYVEGRKSGDLYCSIIPCTTDSSLGCAKRFEHSDQLVPSVEFASISIRAIVEVEGDRDDYLVMPTSLNFNMLPLNTHLYNYSAGETYNVKG